VETSKSILTQWLNDIGLELKPDKTRLTHTLEGNEEPAGFSFLGFEIRQHKVKGKKSKTGFKTIIKPSPKAIQTHLHQVKGIIETYRDAPQSTLIAQLNPLIRGWANYYRAVCSRKVYGKLDHLMYQRLRAWAVRRHRYKREAYKNWRANGQSKWNFATPEGHALLRYSGTKIIRHVKVQGVKSPYDGDWTSWSARMGKYPGVRTQVRNLLLRNKGRCNHCQSYFTPHDILEVHHLDRNHKNNRYDNLWLLHGHCHDELHRRGTNDNG
jgi:RNA-directed DNA polymerase